MQGNDCQPPVPGRASYTEEIPQRADLDQKNCDRQTSALVESSCPTGPHIHLHLYLQGNPTGATSPGKVSGNGPRGKSSLGWRLSPWPSVPEPFGDRGFISFVPPSAFPWLLDFARDGDLDMRTGTHGSRASRLALGSSELPFAPCAPRSHLLRKVKG